VSLVLALAVCLVSADVAAAPAESVAVREHVHELLDQASS
jgi:hypothetical protein